MVFIGRSLAGAGNEAFPDTTGVPAGKEDMAIGIPFIEIADHADPLCIGRPDGKEHSLLALVFHDMAAQFFIQAKVFAAFKKGDIVIGKKRVWLYHWRLTVDGAPSTVNRWRKVRRVECFLQK